MDYFINKLHIYSFPGEIQGTIHKRVLDRYQPGLCPGSGLILKQVCDGITLSVSSFSFVYLTPHRALTWLG